MAEPADAIMIKEELIRMGVAEDVATDAKHVFYTVRRYQNPRTSFVINDRFGMKELPPHRYCTIAADVTDCLRVLEDCGFIVFRSGRHTLTEMGKRVK